jgi:hypothetical protein
MRGACAYAIPSSVRCVCGAPPKDAHTHLRVTSRRSLGHVCAFPVGALRTRSRCTRRHDSDPTYIGDARIRRVPSHGSYARSRTGPVPTDVRGAKRTIARSRVPAIGSRVYDRAGHTYTPSPVLRYAYATARLPSPSTPRIPSAPRCDTYRAAYAPAFPLPAIPSPVRLPTHTSYTHARRTQGEWCACAK